MSSLWVVRAIAP